MPEMDNTGPLGTGPYGRGLGPCGGGQRGFGRFGRYGRGGSGWGRLIPALSPEEENDLLEQEKNWLETRLAAIKKRLRREDIETE